ncbi:hypothetical protein F5Y01DRAFT_324069 [Xylaria sp. FL0043]|nr:hypothetical protein F5Y01DRAFT_324069 [Xylaria sp. FL0043]
MGSLEQPAWSSVYDESLSLILSLQREDASQVRSTSKGKQVEGTLSDADLALQLYVEDLNRATVAVQTDTTLLLESEWQESVARCDREIATAQSAGRSQRQIQMPDLNKLSVAEEQKWETLASKYIGGTDETKSDGSFYDCIDMTSSETDGQPESASWAASRAQKKSPCRPCIACSDIKNVADLARAPCKHDYCGECLENLFRSAMIDESLFPPRCCHQDIPVDKNRLFLGDDLVEQFTQKSIELTTPNRTYCHQPTCSAFIPPKMIKDGIAQCPECKARTCETCKGATHAGDCPSDIGLQQVLELARQEKWQRCPKCFTMVELDTGCFHMTCKCKAQFCYLCAAKWKTCTCVQWDEARLYDRAEAIYDRNPVDEHVHAEDPENTANLQSTAAETRTAEIGRIMEHLVQNHECGHWEWISRRGPRRCEECRQSMPLFIYECRNCSIMACRRCRYNRL